MLNYNQFDSLIVTPVLSAFQLDNEGWHMLINGTIAHESKGGTYLKQIDGPALGICQMEETTHNSIWQAYLPHQPIMSHKLMTLCTYSRPPRAEQMVNDLLYSVAMCVLLYKWRLDSDKIPHPNSLENAATIWKAIYNTKKGKGTVDEFVNDYNEFTGSKKAQKNTKKV